MVVLGIAASGAVSSCIHYEVLGTEVRAIMFSLGPTMALTLTVRLVSCRSARAVPANRFSLLGA